ncbi:unnamed protein product [Rotaria sp. Silwood2]|nr:unnamed protein product [Rotaria sp. Silwood2]CAF4629170.1 unnamed protein product [Rotaria sp. Silwood2]
MLLSRIFIAFFFFFFVTCNALQCITNCWYTYKLTTPFSIPSNCNQSVSAGKCRASLSFTYGVADYIIEFEAASSNVITDIENLHQTSLILPSTGLLYFTYDIKYACNDKDDCAQELAKNASIEMLQRQADNPEIREKLTSFIKSPILTSNNSNISCYDSNENERQCSTLTQRRSCVISHNIFQNKIDRSCDDRTLGGVVSINIFQTPSSAAFIIYCNQVLCNTNSTLQKVKDIMFEYNVTATSDGRLIDVEYVGNYEFKLMISIPLMIMMIFSLLLN